MTRGNTVLYEVKDKVAYITLNRPDSLNALNRTMLVELRETWLNFERDSEALVGIITGAGRAFCGGFDLAAVDDSSKEPVDMGPLDSAIQSYGVYVSKPLIAAVNGYAIGGGIVLAGNCDIKVASEKAKFSFPEAKAGICGGGLELVNSMHLSAAVELMLTGEPMDAQRAYEVGFVNRVVPHENLMEEAERFANILKRNAPLTMKMIKAYIFEEKKTFLQRYHIMRGMYVSPQLESDDLWEGVAAFKEKRPPRFEGK